MPPEPKAPPGYRHVDEVERLATLETLRQRRAQVEVQIRGLPLRIETVGQRQRERDLHTRVDQLEKLLTMFQKPTVFVPADAEPISKTGIHGAGNVPSSVGLAFNKASEPPGSHSTMALY
mmetsp:Transcript_16885/g.46528  ORF Transcript_16885/g.46528 Transcript_16885/m.46528 type:complete len:120 (-) Transcript_16885:72-431(-)